MICVPRRYDHPGALMSTISHHVVRTFRFALTAGLKARTTTTCGALIVACGLVLQSQAPPASASHKQLLVIFDGLRPDYVTPDVMPNLYAFGQRGIVFTNHHSVFPTVTRVNTSSISTGSYPERHGLLGNSVFFPQIDPTRFQDTSDRSAMVRV